MSWRVPTRLTIDRRTSYLSNHLGLYLKDQGEETEGDWGEDPDVKTRAAEEGDLEEEDTVRGHQK